MQERRQGLSREEIERADRFEAAFNRIHAIFRAMAMPGRDDSFMTLLHELSARHSHIRMHKRDLKQYARLRNAMVHEYVAPDYYIAVPHESVVRRIESIHRRLASPPGVMAIAARPVTTFRAETQLREVLAAIERHGYTSFPVYGASGFAGLLTEDGISRWLSSRLQRSLTVDFGDVRLEEALTHERPQNVVFVPRTLTVFDIEEIYEARLVRKEKVDAVLVTEGGQPEQEPLGIITSWDLVKVDAWDPES